MNIITGHMERNMADCAVAAERILHFVTDVIRISTSEMHAEFSSRYLKAYVSLYRVILSLEVPNYCL